MSKRALRRHQRARILACSVSILEFREPWNTEVRTLERAKRRADNMAVCSCNMCCNPRRSKINVPRQTRAEIKSGLALWELLFEVPRSRVRLP